VKRERESTVDAAHAPSCSSLPVSGSTAAPQPTMDSSDEVESTTGGAPRVQLPLSCDPPGPNNPVKQRAWIVFGGTGHMGRTVVKAALAHGDLVTSIGRCYGDSISVMKARISASISPPSLPGDHDHDPGPAPESHPNLLCLLCDVRVRASVAAAFTAHLSHWKQQLDVVANCSGYGILGACEDQDDAEIRNQFEINFWGTLHIVQLSLPHLRTHGGGKYLIFSSTSGALGVPGLGPYCATKYAVEGLVESMLYEVDTFDIRVTLVSPGHVRRDEPEDKAEQERANAEAAVKPQDAQNNGTGTGSKTATQSLSLSSLLPYGPFLIKPSSPAYSGPGSPAGHAKRIVQWMENRQPTSAVKAGELIWQLGHCSYPPLRLLLGSFAVESIRDRLRTIIEEIEDWKFLSFGEESGEGDKARERILGRLIEEESSDEDGIEGEEDGSQHDLLNSSRHGSMNEGMDDGEGDDDDDDYDEDEEEMEEFVEQ